jgi:hypothetical protein
LAFPRGQRPEEVLDWWSFEWLRHQPTKENARTTKRAFDVLAERHRPD